jgi:hydroxymethylglutaryl-CoA reductase (NADPH)
MLAQEIPATVTASDRESKKAAHKGREAEPAPEEKRWIMKAAKTSDARTSIRMWAMESWTAFVDLLKVRATSHLVVTVTY